MNANTRWGKRKWSMIVPSVVARPVFLANDDSVVLLLHRCSFFLVETIVWPFSCNKSHQPVVQHFFVYIFF